MARLVIRLLGPPCFELEGAEIRFERRKVAALLAYLAVTARSHSRDELSELLFPQQARARARSGFRHTLSVLRAAIGAVWLSVDRSTVALKGGEGLWVDVHEFRRLIARTGHGAETGRSLTPAARELGEAARLYRGEFLSGFYLKDSVAFEEWQFLQRDTLQQEYACILERLVEVHSSRGELEQALRFGRSWLGLDPLEEAVHRRLMTLYSLAGRRSAALRQYESCRSLLARELGEAPEPETERLCQVIRRGRRVSPDGRRQAALRPVQELVPGNLPAYATSLVGRERELAEVADLILKPEVRILTLTGCGGTGKTRLAVRVASELGGFFEHGVHFLDLSALQEPEEVVPAIARALDLQESRGPERPLLEILKSYFKERRLLLLLDTFEHLKRAAVQLQEMIVAGPGCKALLTSRISLSIPGAWEYPVPPLSLPEPGSATSAKHLGRCEAVRLLVARTKAVRPGFSLSTESVDSLAELCRRLDGLPLAIELAASRLKILSVQDLLELLSDRFGILRADDGGRPVRQQTLLGTIEWSYELLGEAEKRLFACLSVFRGGCSLEAAQEVCGQPPGQDRVDILEGLTSLADKSLVLREERAGETRIRLLDTIREYARLRLEEDPQAEAVRQRHASFFLDLALKAEPELHGPDQVDWLRRLERERGNLQETMRWLLAGGRVREALRLGTALTWYCTMCGHFSEGSRWLEQALRRESAAPDPAARAPALNGLGWLLFTQGYWSRAREMYEESLELFRALGDRRGEGIVLSDLAVVQRWLGDREAGTRCAEEGIAIARELGDPRRIAISLIWAYATTGGRFSGAPPQAQLEEAVELAQQV